MNQRKLYHTIENLTPDGYEKDEELLGQLLEEIIKQENIELKGGRIWKLNPNTKSYTLIKQTGDIERIKEGYVIPIEEYPAFLEIAKRRSVAADETNMYLRRKGITKYSATGVGEKVKVNGMRLYPYVLAFNANNADERLLDTLNIISSAVSSAIKTKRSEAQTKLLEKDLDKAREIQRSILPEHEFHFGDYELFGISIADHIVGGDFFDYLPIGEDTDRLGVAIGDAASKGISAAVQALYISGALRMGVEYQTKITTLIKKISNLVYRVFPDERFITLFYAELFDNKNGLCIYANAGHNNPLYLNAATGQIQLLENTGPVLGLSPDQKYSTENINMKTGDILLLYTDGITEARNANFELYGEERLIQKLKDYKGLSAKEITEDILEEVQTFSAQGTYSDDKTLVTVKRVK